MSRVLLSGISLCTYEQLLDDYNERGSVHFAFDHGDLEITVIGFAQAALQQILTLLVNLWAEESGIKVHGVGSMTLRRHDLACGLEPDRSFYIRNEELVRGKPDIDLVTDPPPDLVVIIDIVSPSLNKFPIFAALGIPEVWRYDGERVSIWKLETHDYHELAESQLLPSVTGAVLTELLEAGRQMKRTAWLRRVRNWARQSR